MSLNPLEMQRLLITSSLLAGAYITYTCPCGNPITGEGLLSCHLNQFFLATTIPLAIVLYVNRNNLSNNRYG